MHIQSHIDWNELFPLLPKPLRDSMLLEAVTLLSTPHRSRNGAAVESSTSKRHGIRWTGTGRLACAGRKYNINRTAFQGRGFGALGKLRKQLIESKGDTITYEGIVSLQKGNEFQAQRSIFALWKQGTLIPTWEVGKKEISNG